jgi:hypothetical protein
VGAECVFCAFALFNKKLPFNGFPPKLGFMGVYTNSELIAVFALSNMAIDKALFVILLIRINLPFVFC